MNLAPLPEFDLFSIPPTQNTVEKDICTEHRPISTISSATSPIQFAIHTGVDEYIQFRETELYMRIKISIDPVINGVVTRTAEAKAKITKDEWAYISPVNYLLHSLIKQVHISVGNTQIACSSPTYAYRAYIEALLGYGTDAKSSFLTGALWCKDEAGKMEEINKKRSIFLHNDELPIELELIGKLHLDLSFQHKALLGGCTVNISLFPNDPSFYIRCNPAKVLPHVEIIDACLYVHRSKVNKLVVQAHSSALRLSNAKYFFTRCDVKSFSFSKGALEAQLNNVVNGLLPRRIFVACVSSEAFSGTYETNPFNFKHYNINYLVCYIDGEQYPQKAYQPDFANKKFMREFMGLFEATNQNEVHSNIDISRSDFCNGYTLFGFNFSPDLSEGAGIGGHLSTIKRGTLRVEIRFAQPLPETINVLVFCEFDSVIEIDKNRNITQDI